ncbi:hypothetical protein [Streptomyces sp. NBC_00723]|uniref:hypothetical protein n=1 Tax=Streptomyces sp. NBC_00723 TaxID=2903673 RepID=UPI003864A30F
MLTWVGLDLDRPSPGKPGDDLPAARGGGGRGLGVDLPYGQQSPRGVGVTEGRPAGARRGSGGEGVEPEQGV